MTKILITGAGGYIGSCAVYLFLQNDFEVVGLDNFSRGYKQPLEVLQNKFGQKRFRFYTADLRDKDSLKAVFEQESDISAVIHYSALCLVDESMKDPLLYFQNNVSGGINLLEVMQSSGVSNLVFSSTCAVYGESEYVPVDEKHKTLPTNPYGESKLMFEKIIDWQSKLKDLNYVVLRYFNVCGASDDGLIGDSKKPSVLLVQNAVRGALGIDKFYLTCPEVDTEDKTPIRDYVNVMDLNMAHLKALSLLLKQKLCDVFNIGTGTGYSVLQVVNMVQDITGKKFDIVKGEKRQGEYARIYANIEKAKKILGWRPQHTLKDSVESLIKWYQKHPNGWDY
ncbi:MAG: UDP-glucose 4-epimerase GalE [Patescibacteria group bacterium]|nr:MAG: UDP-glucose 4-epimerase GalE [Patescibacteria group bacterium]